MPALDLHRNFARSKLRCYLLIEHARNHQAQDLALTRSQRLVTLSQVGKLALLLARHPVAVQSLVNRIQEILIAKRLREEFHRPGFHSLDGHRNISMTGNEDDGNLDTRIR